MWLNVTASPLPHLRDGGDSSLAGWKEDAGRCRRVCAEHPTSVPGMGSISAALLMVLQMEPVAGTPRRTGTGAAHFRNLGHNFQDVTLKIHLFV